MARILLTGGRAPAALELARLFQRCGHCVDVAESWFWSASRFSRTVQRNLRVAPPRQAYAAFAQQLRRAVQRGRYDVLIPTCEEIFWVARARPLLSPHVTVFCPTLEELRELHDKYAFSQLLSKAGLPGPTTTLLQSERELRAYAQNAPESVYKPSYSRFGTRALIRPSPAQLKRVRPSKTHPWTAQHHKGGREWCAFAVLRAGAVAALGVYPARFPVGGASTYFQAIHHPGIQAWVEAFGAFTLLTGQVAFDFKEDAAGLWALECNPRLTSGLHLFRDQPEVTRTYLAPTPQEPLLAAPAGPLALKAVMFLGGVRRASDWHAWRTARDVMIAPHDPWPALMQPVVAGAWVVRALRLGTGVLEATTHDIEWNGEA
ncbi:hypothetical protein [Deinococcus hopiensis]|uniref:ATP-grasp domain-containing protein n=1 Tax=Deinococcus hopiensis KR-140 TaxID=695939 RepID=A0A1W1UD58_9DEIO|nr:hypothetical protein [Deinococcus hopiensis]SMB78952.1 hypothetical protein SAMN00790413_05705 [Deinococcus hopiensis KR-140]